MNFEPYLLVSCVESAALLMSSVRTYDWAASRADWILGSGVPEHCGPVEGTQYVVAAALAGAAHASDATAETTAADSQREPNVRMFGA